MRLPTVPALDEILTGVCHVSYWTEDPSTLNSHFGSEADLKSLSDELHKRSMYLMVDVVINHLVATQNPPQYSSFPSPFSAQSAFHAEQFIQATDYPSPPFSAGNQTAVEQGWLGDEKLPLVDINTEDQSIQNWWYDWIKNLVSTYSIDGVRIDTVKHIRQDFWTGFKDAAGVWSVGEVLANETEYVGPYTSEFRLPCGPKFRVLSRQQSSFLRFSTTRPGSLSSTVS